MKALFGSAIASTLDERETIAVPQIGEEDDGHVNHVPKSLLVSIIAPRLEETFEMVRNRLEASGFDKIAGRRVVLTGGACQLHGVRELAGLILDKQVRIGRPQRIKGLAEATHGPAFSDGRGAAALRIVRTGRIAARPAAPGGRHFGPRWAVAAREFLNAVAFLSRGGYVGAGNTRCIEPRRSSAVATGGPGMAGQGRSSRRGGRMA